MRQGEPGKVEKSEAWQTAIGLQAVDGLKTFGFKGNNKSLQNKSYIRRESGKRYGKWEVLV